MITLKNGKEIKYNQEFDLFFKELYASIIQESKIAVETNFEHSGNPVKTRELLLKEIMDNCIVVTNQLFKIAETNKELSNFIVTGFLFNSLILNINDIERDITNEINEKSIH